MTVIRDAWRQLYRKRTRTWLTVLGIFIGVSLVTVVTMIGEIGETVVGTELENMGLGGLSVTADGKAVLENDDLGVLRAMADVSSAVPLMLSTCTVSAPDGSQSLMLCGIDSGEVQAIGLSQCYGRMLSAKDIHTASRVCVVDTAVAQALFFTENAVGRSVMLPVGGGEEAFTVVGVSKAGSALLQNVSQWIPGMVYVPYTAMQELTGREDFDQVAVRLYDGTDEDQAAARIERVLTARHDTDGYRAENLSAQKERLSGLMTVVTRILTVISAISLLVAGLSIMTVMTVSVGERTREIGIKKALGATDRRIMNEFLCEALLLSLVGGAGGVVVAGVAVTVGCLVLGLPLVPLSSALWLIGFAAVVGMVFGVIPARTAARLDPVEALRFE